ncbi:MAG: hypothetical protein RLZZ455_1133 [Candidatus Parcubacteria bacterium]|jgi:dTMP kinase
MKYHLEFDIDLKRNPYKGKYIVIEGIDGSGKSTQVKLVKEALEKSGKIVLETSEPNTHDRIGMFIREVLSGKEKISPVAIQYLFSANRATTHEEIIIPALKRGDYVVSHRCFWSAVAYGMVDRAEEVKESVGNQVLIAQSILSMYHQFIVPDCTVYLQVSVDTAMQRLEDSGKQLETLYERREKLEKIVQGYEWLLEQFPDEFRTIPAEGSTEDVTKNILTSISV